MVLHYDGSLSGFLCLLGTAIKEHLEVTTVCRQQQPTTAALFCPELIIETENAWAAKVASGLERKLGETFMTCSAQALFSEIDGIELDLLTLTRRALKEGPKILHHLADPLIGWINAAALKTSRERHRLLGLLRFERLCDDSYLARSSPRTNVVPLLGSHFAQRLGDQRWLIVDEKRKVGIWGENRRWQLVEEIVLSGDLTHHENERELTDLWRNFYRSVSNPDRRNPKLRQQFMPKMYWQYLTEMQPAQ